MGKIESYLGFAQKAKKIIYGTTLLSKARSIQLIILCESAGKNAQKDGETYATRHNCPLLKTKGMLLESVAGKSGTKICGVTDKNMVEGIMASANMQDNYEIIKTSEEK